MGRVSEMAIEREGALDMMTSLELAEELYKRLSAEFQFIETSTEAVEAHILLSDLSDYIKRSMKHVAMDKEPVVEKETKAVPWKDTFKEV